MKALLLTIALTFAGCGHTLYMMKDPKTGQIAQCAGISHYRYRAVRNAEYCARTYEQAGYVRVPRT